MGAYGVGSYAASKPSSLYSGMWLNPLLQAGSDMDHVYVMSYDAGSATAPAGNPTGYDFKVCVVVVVGGARRRALASQR